MRELAAWRQSAEGGKIAEGTPRSPAGGRLVATPAAGGLFLQFSRKRGRFGPRGDGRERCAGGYCADRRGKFLNTKFGFTASALGVACGGSWAGCGF